MAKNISTALRNLTVMLSTAFAKIMSNAEPADWQKFTMKETTRNKSKHFAWLSKFPRLETWAGQRNHQTMAKHSYSIEVERSTATVDIDRTELEDEGPNVYQYVPAMAKESIDVERNEQIFGLLNKATVCHDGQNYFDNDHPIYPNVDGTGTASTYSNLLGSKGSTPSWVLMQSKGTVKPVVLVERDKPELKNTKDTEPYFENEIWSMGVRIREGYGVTFPQLAVKSYEDLTESNFQDALTKLQNMKTDGDRLMHIKPDLLIVPPALEAAARKLIDAQFDTSGASNVYYKRVELLVSSYFTGA